MQKKILVLVLVICMVFNLIPAFTQVSYATTEKNIRVRVEGKSDTLYDKKITVTNEVYGWDVLKTALGEENIDSTYYEDYDAYLINQLLGEGGEYREGEFSTGWMYYAKKGNEIIQPAVGINKFEIQDIDELIFYISASDSSWNPLTAIPSIDVTNTGNQYEMTVQQSVYGIENADVDISYIGSQKTDENGKVSFEIGKGIYDVVISKGTDYPEIVRQHVTIEGEGSDIIKSTVQDLKEYYKSEGQYSFREAAALSHTGENINEIEDINQKFKINEDESAAAYAGNIIGLIAAGKDARNYDGKNYVELLAASQNAEGKFIIGQWDDYPTTIAYAIIALDMANENYNAEAAVNALISFADNGNFGSVDDTAMSIIALANHKDINGVQDVINLSIDYLKSQQLSTGGFAAWGAENPYSIATVIQALVANHINPLSEEWTKNNNTMLDALLQFKEENHFKYTSQWGTDIDSATEQAFTALADLYRGRSMYQNLKEFKITSEAEFTVTRVGSQAFNKGQEARLEVNVQNNTDTNKQVTFIVALYDNDQNKMIHYTYLTQTLGAGENENIAGGFLIPESGNFEVRGFLWDNMQDMNVLTEPVIVEVQ
ncbi:MAG: hypothetical protein PWP27_1255 [Clostridiales bacterium]|nr:hypothetical protein [Clostridiales bacterium]MDK2933445.1 hypothetical protein [Clostridiales bacterium]